MKTQTMLGTKGALAALALGTMMMATPAGAQTTGGAVPTNPPRGGRVTLAVTPPVLTGGSGSGAASANAGAASGGAGAGAGGAPTADPKKSDYSAFVLKESTKLAELAGQVHEACAGTPDERNAAIATAMVKAVLKAVFEPDGKKALTFDKVDADALFPKHMSEDARKAVYDALAKLDGRAALPPAPGSPAANALASPPLKEYFAKLTNNDARDQLCKLFAGPSAAVVDVTAFRDDALANAAVVADHASVKKVEAAIQKLAEPMAKLPSVADGLDPLAKVNTLLTSGALGAGALAAFGAEYAALALQGLAKLVVERAKYETAMWALDQVGKQVCGDAPEADPSLKVFHEEMRTYWTPNLCRHAKDGVLWEYGTNTATLSALRADIEADVRSWPGNAVGLGVGALLKLDVARCSTPPKATDLPGCEGLDDSIKAARTATAKHLTSILDGTAAPLALSKLGGELLVANEHASPAVGKRLLRSPKIALLACAATLPQEIASKRAVIGIEDSDGERTRAAVLASLAASNACFHLFGSGKVLDEACLTAGTCTPGVGLQDGGGKLERLTTIARLDGGIGAAVRDVETHAQALQSAIEALPKAAATAREALDKWKDVKPPTIDASALAKGDSPEKILQSYLSGVQSAYELAAVRDYLVAVIAVAKASVGLSQSVTGGLLVATDLKGLLPGLCDGAPAACLDAPQLAAGLTKVGATLDELNNALTVLQRIAAYDWSNAVRDGLQALRKGFADKGADDPAVARVARIGVFLSSVLAARDGDQMAVVLDSIADPPGGWRHKQTLGAFTVSVSAFPSLFAGAELRRGHYLVEENFNDTHGIAPALTLPVGVDLAWGFRGGTFGLFLPILDPAGFLQYDADADAKLPGASIKTALAFGIGARYAPKDTPLNLMLMLPFFRPGFRQAEPDATGTGADAFQIGFALGVDVTLFELASQVSR